MKKLILLCLLSWVCSGYVIKETKSGEPVSVYVKKSGTMFKLLDADGTTGEFAIAGRLSSASLSLESDLTGVSGGPHKYGLFARLEGGLFVTEDNDINKRYAGFYPGQQLGFGNLIDYNPSVYNIIMRSNWSSNYAVHVENVNSGPFTSNVLQLQSYGSSSTLLNALDPAGTNSLLSLKADGAFTLGSGAPGGTRFYGYVSDNWNSATFPFIFDNAETTATNANGVRIIAGGAGDGDASAISFQVEDRNGNIDVAIKGDGTAQFQRTMDVNGDIDLAADKDIIRGGTVMPWPCAFVLDCSTGTCSVANHRGACLDTITRNAAGNYTGNFVASFWANDPVCTCTVVNEISDPWQCDIKGGTTTTSVDQLYVWRDLGGSSSVNDADVAVNCLGERAL